MDFQPVTANSITLSPPMMRISSTVGFAALSKACSFAEEILSKYGKTEDGYFSADTLVFLNRIREEAEREKKNRDEMLIALKLMISHRLIVLGRVPVPGTGRVVREAYERRIAQIMTMLRNTDRLRWVQLGRVRELIENDETLLSVIRTTELTHDTHRELLTYADVGVLMRLAVQGASPGEPEDTAINRTNLLSDRYLSIYNPVIDPAGDSAGFAGLSLVFHTEKTEPAPQGLPVTGENAQYSSGGELIYKTEKTDHPVTEQGGDEKASAGAQSAPVGTAPQGREAQNAAPVNVVLQAETQRNAPLGEKPGSAETAAKEEKKNAAEFAAKGEKESASRTAAKGEKESFAEIAAKDEAESREENAAEAGASSLKKTAAEEASATEKTAAQLSVPETLNPDTGGATETAEIATDSTETAIAQELVVRSDGVQYPIGDSLILKYETNETNVTESSQTTVTNRTTSSQTTVTNRTTSSQTAVANRTTSSQTTVTNSTTSSQTTVTNSTVSSQTTATNSTVSSQTTVTNNSASSQTEVAINSSSSQTAVANSTVSSQTAVTNRSDSSQIAVQNTVQDGSKSSLTEIRNTVNADRTEVQHTSIDARTQTENYSDASSFTIRNDAAENVTPVEAAGNEHNMQKTADGTAEQTVQGETAAIAAQRQTTASPTPESILPIPSDQAQSPDGESLILKPGTHEYNVTDISENILEIGDDRLQYPGGDSLILRSEMNESADNTAIHPADRSAIDPTQTVVRETREITNASRTIETAQPTTVQSAAAPHTSQQDASALPKGAETPRDNIIEGSTAAVTVKPGDRAAERSGAAATDKPGDIVREKHGENAAETPKRQEGGSPSAVVPATQRSSASPVGTQPALQTDIQPLYLRMNTYLSGGASYFSHLYRKNSGRILALTSLLRLNFAQLQRNTEHSMLLKALNVLNYPEHADENERTLLYRAAETVLTERLSPDRTSEFVRTQLSDTQRTGLLRALTLSLRKQSAAEESSFLPAVAYEDRLLRLLDTHGTGVLNDAEPLFYPAVQELRYYYQHTDEERITEEIENTVRSLEKKSVVRTPGSTALPVTVTHTARDSHTEQPLRIGAEQGTDRHFSSVPATAEGVSPVLPRSVLRYFSLTKELLSQPSENGAFAYSGYPLHHVTPLDTVVARRRAALSRERTLAGHIPSVGSTENSSAETDTGGIALISERILRSRAEPSQTSRTENTVRSEKLTQTENILRTENLAQTENILRTENLTQTENTFHTESLTRIASDTRTNSVLPAEPTEYSDTTAVFRSEPAEYSGTAAVLHTEPAEYSDTAAVFRTEPTEYSDTAAVLHTEPAEYSGTAAVFRTEPAEYSDTAAVLSLREPPPSRQSPPPAPPSATPASPSKEELISRFGNLIDGADFTGAGMDAAIQGDSGALARGLSELSARISRAESQAQANAEALKALQKKQSETEQTVLKSSNMNQLSDEVISRLRRQLRLDRSRYG